MANDNILGSTEQVVSSRVVGSSNPILKKFGSIGNAIKGVGCGFVLVIACFALIWYSINGVQERSKIVGLLDLITVDQVKDQTGMVKVQGVPKLINAASDNALTISNALYFDVKYERWEVIKEVTTETRTRTENGKEIEDKVEKTTYKEGWVTKTDNAVWAEFNMGTMSVQAQKAELIGSTSDKVVSSITAIPNFSEPLNNYGQAATSKVGSLQAEVSYVPFTGQQLLVVGEKKGDLMQSGNPFIISDKSDSDLIANLQNSENTQRIIWMVAAWVTCFIGFSMILAPIIELVDWIPMIGGAAKFTAGVIAAVLATIIVLMGFLFIKFWYLFLALLVLAVVLAIYLLVKAFSKKKQ